MKTDPSKPQTSGGLTQSLQRLSPGVYRDAGGRLTNQSGQALPQQPFRQQPTSMGRGTVGPAPYRPGSNLNQVSDAATGQSQPQQQPEQNPSFQPWNYQPGTYRPWYLPPANSPWWTQPQVQPQAQPQQDQQQQVNYQQPMQPMQPDASQSQPMSFEDFVRQRMGK
jgi:hypothetical protein